MKKLLFSFLIVSLAATLWANNRNRSELRISLFDGSAFNITVGNLKFNNQSTFYALNNLKPGRHFVEITKTERYRDASGRWRVNNVIVFADYINLPRAMVLVGEINRRGRFVVTNQFAFHGNEGHFSGGYGWSNNGYGNNYPTHGYPVMSNQSFGALLGTLRHTSFDRNKLDIAKQALAWNWLTAKQVRELMHVFSFESSKLEMAKFAYNSTVDRENYFIVHDAFTFSSSSRELNRYIASSY